MPSDPSGHSPSGVLIRPAPDFYDDNMAVGAADQQTYGGSSPNDYISVALYNNDDRGRVFKVYAIENQNDGATQFGVFSKKGTIGSLATNCRSIRLDGPAPPGQIYLQVDTVAGSFDPPPYSFGPLIGLLAAGSFGGGLTVSTFPLFIVPKGYSLILATIIVGINGGACFWYQVSNE